MKNRLQHATRGGVTLVELLIVIVILAILAAVVAPVFQRSGLEAQEAVLRQDLSIVRSALERYQVQHEGKYPGYPAAGGAPTQAVLRKQLTLGSQVDGSTGGAGNPAYPLGPYISGGLPQNAVSRLGSIAIVPDGAPIPPPDGVTGYVYKPETGEFRVNLLGSALSGEAYYDL